MSKDERIGILKNKIETRENEISINAVKLQKRNIFISIAVALFSLFFVYFIASRLSGEELILFYEKYKILVYFVPIGVFTTFAAKIFTLDLEKLKKDEEIRAEAELRTLKNELQALEDE